MGNCYPPENAGTFSTNFIVELHIRVWCLYFWLFNSKAVFQS